MNPAPQTKGFELLGIAQAFHNAASVDPFALKRLRRDVDAQIVAAPYDANAYGALMVVSMLERKPEDVRKAFTKGVALADNDTVYKNASSAFFHLGMVSESWKVVQEGLVRHRNSQCLLQNVALVGFASGRVRAAGKAHAELKKQKPEDALLYEDEIKDLVSYLDQNEISDEGASSVISPMITAQAKYTNKPGMGSVDVIYYSADEDGPERAVLRYVGFVPSEHIIDVIEDYSELVVESAPLSIRNRLGADMASEPFDNEHRSD